MREDIDQINLDARLGRIPEEIPDFELLEMIVSEHGRTADIFVMPPDDGRAAEAFAEKLVSYYQSNHSGETAYARNRAKIIAELSPEELAQGFAGEMPDSVSFMIRVAGPAEIRADFEELGEYVRMRAAESRKPRYAEAVFLGALDLPFRMKRRPVAIAELTDRDGRRKGVLIVDGINGAIAPSPHGLPATKVWYDSEFRPNSYFEEQSLVLKSAMRFHLELSASVEPKVSREDVSREILLTRPVYDSLELAMTFGDKLAEYRDDLSVVCEDNGVRSPESLPFPVLRELNDGFRAALEPLVTEAAETLHEDFYQAFLPMIEEIEESKSEKRISDAPKP